MTDPLSSPRRNLERKCRCADLSIAAAALEYLGARSEGELEQTDVYFRVSNGRLKLRTTPGQPAVLIWYERPNEMNARWSRYYLVPISDPTTLRTALAAALGERGEVRKRRTLWLWHNVRIHLDEVAGLGTFVEFEAVMSASEDEGMAHARLAELAAVLGLTPAHDVAGSYADLLGF